MNPGTETAERTGGNRDEDLALRLYSLAEAAKILDPSGEKVSVNTLRREHKKGRIKFAQVGGKHFITRQELKNFVERVQCLDETSDPGSESRDTPPENNIGSSVTTRTAQKRNTGPGSPSAARKATATLKRTRRRR